MNQMAYRAFLPNIVEGSSYGYLPYELYLSVRQLQKEDIILIRTKYYRIEFISYNKYGKVYELYLKYIENASKL